METGMNDCHGLHYTEMQEDNEHFGYIHHAKCCYVDIGHIKLHMWFLLTSNLHFEVQSENRIGRLETHVICIYQIPVYYMKHTKWSTIEIQDGTSMRLSQVRMAWSICDYQKSIQHGVFVRLPHVHTAWNICETTTCAYSMEHLWDYHMCIQHGTSETTTSAYRIWDNHTYIQYGASVRLIQVHTAWNICETTIHTYSMELCETNTSTYSMEHLWDNHTYIQYGALWDYHMWIQHGAFVKLLHVHTAWSVCETITSIYSMERLWDYHMCIQHGASVRLSHVHTAWSVCETITSIYSMERLWDFHMCIQHGTWCKH